MQKMLGCASAYFSNLEYGGREIHSQRQGVSPACPGIKCRTCIDLKQIPCSGKKKNSGG